MSIKKVLRTLLVHLSIWAVGDVIVTALLREKFEWPLLLFVAGAIVIRDAWKALRGSSVPQAEQPAA